MRVILHIGTPKTGTTAIQSFLFDHRAALADRGVIYPSIGLVTDDAFGPRHKRLSHRGHYDERRWERLLRELSSGRAETAVLSCEAFWRYPERASELRQRLAGHKVTIVAFLRRQDRFLASLHLQLIKQFDRTVEPRALWQERQGAMDYSARLDEWSAAFGAQAIVARLYSEEEREDVVPAFLDAAKLVGSAAGLPITVNRRRNPTQQEWTSGGILGEDLCAEILAAFEVSNRRLREQYLPNAPAIWA